jgi:ATP-dependent Clp protease, protease subunit
MSTIEKFWNISAAGREAEVDIFGVIGGDMFEESVAASDFIRDLRALGKVSKLNINIHSPGGSVYDGLAIYRALRDVQGEKVAHVASLAASSASFIMLAADRIEVAPEATVMIHDPMMMAFVTSAAEAASVNARWTQAKNQILDIYVRRTGQDREVLSDLMAAETWYVGQEIKDAGFADEVKADKPKTRIAAQIPESVAARWKHAPKALFERKPAPLAPEVEARMQKLGLFNG